MERGLLWLPLLVLFFWLAWAGWNEYQKLEAYKVWAQGFERAKYDIRSVLGQSGDQLTWGRPTRKGPVNLQTISRAQVSSVELWIDDAYVSFEEDTVPPSEYGKALRGQYPELRLQLPQSVIRIPFTDGEMALQWGLFLKQWLLR